MNKQIEEVNSKQTVLEIKRYFQAKSKGNVMDRNEKSDSNGFNEFNEKNIYLALEESLINTPNKICKNKLNSILDQFKHNIKNHNVDLDTCKPSGIKLFHKEKLENILKNKIEDQLNLKNCPKNTFLTYNFIKNSKTGEYESNELKQKTNQNINNSVELKENVNNTASNSKVRAMIAKFESKEL
jgi:hypothetical protein